MKRKLLLAFAIFALAMLSGCFNVEEADVKIVLNPGVDTVEINTTYTDPGATATAKGIRISYTVIENTIATTTLGTYLIRYETTYRGFTKQALRMVRVVDETPPLLALKAGLDTIYEGETWTDAGVIASDNSGLAPLVTVSGSVSNQLAGEYIIRYQAEDASGNQSEIIRYVNVLKKP